MGVDHGHLALARPAARAALLLAVALVGAASAGCGGADGGSPGSTSTPTCTPIPAEPVVLEGKLAVFDLTGVAKPIAVASQDGYFVIDARADGQITDLTIALQQVVVEAGFDIAGMDDEGFEAEVFFARGNVAAGQIVLTESTCPGVVDLQFSVLDHPAVFPGGTPPG